MLRRVGKVISLRLMLSLVVAIWAMWQFAGITEDVVTSDVITAYDVTILTWLRAHATPGGDAAFFVISMLGSPATMTVLGLAGFAWFTSRRAWVELSGWCAAFAGAGIVDAVLKSLIQRPRPAGSDVFVGGSFSFPSGHALGSLCGYGMLACMLSRHYRGWVRVAVAVAAPLIILFVGVSRLVLGVHYFSDVVGGYAAGAAWLLVCVVALEAHRPRHPSPPLMTAELS